MQLINRMYTLVCGLVGQLERGVIAHVTYCLCKDCCTLLLGAMRSKAFAFYVMYSLELVLKMGRQPQKKKKSAPEKHWNTRPLLFLTSSSAAFVSLLPFVIIVVFIVNVILSL